MLTRNWTLTGALIASGGLITPRSKLRLESLRRTALGALLLLALACTCINEARAQMPFSKLELGNDHGLTDLQGRELLPAVYAGIKSLGHGLFLLKQRCPDPAERFACAKEKILINRTLIELKTPVPAGASFERVFWLGNEADNNDQFVPDKLPDDALLVFAAETYFGICDSKGNEVLPANCTWIGSLREGIVAIRQADDQLYSFDVNTKRLQKLICQNVRKGYPLRFSDGLAAFPYSLGQGKSCWGYLDTSGKIVIDPKFVFATNFRGGRAVVRFPGEDGKPFNAIIDKSGKEISPTDLKVLFYFCPYIEVQDAAGNYGVVDADHNFKYVIEPKFKTLSAQLATYYSVDETEPGAPPTLPIYYYAIRSEDGQPVMLSAKGDVLFQIPPVVHTNPSGLTPSFRDGVFACNLGLGVPFDKATFLNLQGKVVPAPYSNLSTSKDINFRQVAPGILIKTIKCSDELRQKEKTKILHDHNLIYGHGPVF
jgi:hypothetical protein